MRALGPAEGAAPHADRALLADGFVTDRAARQGVRILLIAGATVVRKTRHAISINGAGTREAGGGRGKSRPRNRSGALLVFPPFGGVAQLVRARGSYPLGPGFKSLHRHQIFPQIARVSARRASYPARSRRPHRAVSAWRGSRSCRSRAHAEDHPAAGAF